MISEGSLVRYVNSLVTASGARRTGLRYNGIYLVVSEAYMTERRRQRRMGWGCKVLVDGVKVSVDLKNLEKVG